MAGNNKSRLKNKEQTTPFTIEDTRRVLKGNGDENSFLADDKIYRII